MTATEADLPLFLLLACALRATGTPETERMRVLAEADALWSARAEAGGIEAPMNLWLGQLAVHPDDPVVLARLARGEWTRGQLAAAPEGPDGAIVRFENGQDFGWRCLLGWPSFSGTLGATGYRVTPEAAAALPPDAAPCVLWTVVSGMSLASVRGPGAALELEGIALLLGRLDELGYPTLEPGFTEWARAQLLTLRAAPDPAPGDARALYKQAIAADPAVLLFRRDFAAAFPDVRDFALDRFDPSSPDPWGLENAAWRAKLEGGE